MTNNFPPEFIEHLFVDCTSRIRAIEERCSALAHSDYASVNPRNYAKLVARIAEAVEREIARLRPKLAIDPESATNQLRFVDGFIQDLGSELRYAEAAVVSKLPWSLSKPFERFLERYLPDKSLMLRPQWSYNYTIRIDELKERYRHDLENFLSPNDLAAIFAPFPDGFHVVSFPAIERKNALLHCDIAHEVGHLVAEQYLTSEPRDFFVDFRTQISIAVAADPTIPPLWHPWEISRRLEKAEHIRRRCLEELISDWFAARSLGPAALFALVAIASGQSLDLPPDEDSDYYPPWRLRIRRQLAILEACDLLYQKPDEAQIADAQGRERLAQWFAALQGVAKGTQDTKAIELDPLVRLAYESAFSALPTIDQNLANRYDSLFPHKAALFGQIYPLLKRIQAGITPNEVLSGLTGKPADLEAILNAAWLYRITVLGPSDNVANDPSRPDLRTLNRLTLRAAELAEIQRDFLGWRESTERQA